jgi:hypothetical protein
LLRTTIEELREKRIDDFVPVEIRPSLDDRWSEFLRVGAHTAEGTLVLPNGETLAVTTRGMAHLLPGRHVTLIERMTRDRGSTAPGRPD